MLVTYIAHDVVMDRFKREKDLTVIIVSTAEMGTDEWDFYKYKCPMIKLDFVPSIFEVLPENSDQTPCTNLLPDVDKDPVDDFFTVKEFWALCGSKKEREELGYPNNLSCPLIEKKPVNELVSEELDK
jgi:hypothetical protein